MQSIISKMGLLKGINEESINMKIELCLALRSLSAGKCNYTHSKFWKGLSIN